MKSYELYCSRHLHSYSRFASFYFSQNKKTSINRAINLHVHPPVLRCGWFCNKMASLLEANSVLSGLLASLASVFSKIGLEEGNATLRLLLCSLCLSNGKCTEVSQYYYYYYYYYYFIIYY